MSPATRCHILIFEPRVAGHHLTWLRYISQDFLAKGYRLTLAIDGRPQTASLYDRLLAELEATVQIISIYDDRGKLHGGSKTAALAAALARSGADHVFINNFDDVASNMFRRASMGSYPPAILRGRMSGVYFRPRFLPNPFWPPGNFIKRIGFQRLVKKGWFLHLFLMDEYLCQEHAYRYPAAGMHFLPDPWSGDFSTETLSARQQLNIACDRLVFLHYGLGARRKGLHLAVEAMNRHPEAKWHLVCAGKLKTDRNLMHRLKLLENSGNATVLDRYVSDNEQQLCFCASDVVLLPYINHFGSSGVLSLAAAAGKIVIASDNGLLGRRVRDHKLGICFSSGNSTALSNAMAQVETMSSEQKQCFAANAISYAGQCDRNAFRRALHSMSLSPKNQ
jgi:hypothetical protein